MLCYVDWYNYKNVRHDIAPFIVSLLLIGCITFPFKLLHKTEYRVRAMSTNIHTDLYFMTQCNPISNIFWISLGPWVHIAQCTCTAIVKWTLFPPIFANRRGIWFHFTIFPNFWKLRHTRMDGCVYNICFNWNICSGHRNLFCSIWMNVCHRFILKIKEG